MRLHELVIEDARLADAPVILDLQREAFRAEAEIYHDDTIAPLTQSLQQLQGEFRVKTILIAVWQGEIVGSVRGSVNGGACLVERLCVLPGWQNRGIATRLLQELEARFADCRRFTLFTGFKSDKNLYLYQKLGYQITRTEKINDRLSLVHMQKESPTVD